MSKLPAKSACGSKYDFQHSLSCKKGGLVSIRRNDIRNFTENILREVCSDVEVKAKLMPLTGKHLQYRSAITGDEARLYIFVEVFGWEIKKHF